MFSQIKLGFFLLVEKLLAWCIIPKFRAAILRSLGAQIGRNVRIYDIRFINLKNGFKNLKVGDDVHIGTDCLFDLEGYITIGNGSTLSPRVLILSHQDPGSSHNSPLTKKFPPEVGHTIIGDYCWVGANSTLISGVSIDNGAVVAAGSLINKNVQNNSLVAGVRSRKIKDL